MSIIAGVLCIGFMEQILLGILIIIRGGILSWLSCILLYRFGQLLDNSDILVDALYKKSAENAGYNIEDEN